MSKYTTEVRFICEQSAELNDSKGYNDVNNIISAALPKIFNFNFPIFDEAYRTTLETKILKHYYTREIGFETVGLWKLYLDRKLNEIMPYYNQLYKSELLEFNPFYDVDVTTKADRGIKHDETTTNHNTRTDNLKEDTTSDTLRTDNLNEASTENQTRTDNLHETGTSNGTRTDNLSEVTDTTGKRTDNLNHKDATTTTTAHSDAYSDTPQGGLSGVNNLEYLTNYRSIDETVNVNNQGSNTGTVDNTGNATTKNTGTQKNDLNTSTDNTGTQNFDIDRNKANTGTQDITTTGSKTNTGTQDNDGNGTRNYNNTDDYLEHVAGKRNAMTYSKMLQEYRDTFLNIDMMVINELSDLFMNLW